MSQFCQGRIISKQVASSKLHFYDLYGDSIRVQVMADARYCFSCQNPFIQMFKKLYYMAYFMTKIDRN